MFYVEAIFVRIMLLVLSTF